MSRDAASPQGIYLTLARYSNLHASHIQSTLFLSESGKESSDDESDDDAFFDALSVCLQDIFLRPRFIAVAICSNTILARKAIRLSEAQVQISWNKVSMFQKHCYHLLQSLLFIGQAKNIVIVISSTAGSMSSLSQ